MKSGFVAIFGRPNVGKSTIMNAILQKKVSIVSPKAQTTRSAIKGIYNDEDSQIVFIDTPGVQKDPNKMGQLMNAMAFNALQDVDAIILAVDASKALYEEEQVLKLKRNEDRPLLVVLNKIDLVRADKMLEVKQKYLELYQGATLIECSAINNFNLDTIVSTLKASLPEGPLYYEKEHFSDAPLKFLLGELVREKVMTLYEKEIPYSTLCVCEEYKIKENRIVLNVTVVVERPTQKAIVIGKNGDMLKKLNHQAKKEIYKLLNKQVDLSLFVKVAKDWKEKESYLRMIRY